MLESTLLGIFVILLLLWIWPGMRASFDRSREMEKDWGALLLPIGLVVAFVLLLILII